MENLSKRPSKGILKSSSSFEQQTEVTQKLVQTTDKDIKWDEMNILQTLHPVDKDYGHMKIEEPKTPYNYYTDNTDGETHSESESHALDPNVLANKISKVSEMPKILADSEDEDEESDENLTEEEKSKKKEFEVKRKMHYNEFQAVKLARKLLAQEEEDDEEEEETARNTGDNGGNADDGHNGNTTNVGRNGPQVVDEPIDTSGVEHISSDQTEQQIVQNR